MVWAAIITMGLLVIGGLAGGARRWLPALLAGLLLAGLGLLVAMAGAEAGRDWRPVLVAAALTAAIGLYAEAIRHLRRRSRAAEATDARPAQPPGSLAPGRAVPAPDPGTLSDPEIDRYLRHIVLREIGGPGQRALASARVLVVGAGGLGAPICLYLAGAGVGRITLADDDRVELSNLHRQVIFTTGDAESHRSKAGAAAAAMTALNPHVAIEVMTRRITADDADMLRGFDLVLDGTDSFASRQGVNRACVAAGVPLIAGSIAQWDGQVTVYDPARGAPCMACLFPRPPAPGTAPDCAEGGVAGPLPGIIGTIMAMEAVKLLTGAGTPLRGRMLIWDGLAGEAHGIALSRNPACPVCADPAADAARTRGDQPAK